mmetsp:Transcript_20756/g.61380  ORF Transcript_20756/g.61380 Transcript_20756/m.61380 type:complete len:210 (+) Transcript_20756:2-631(+)
MSCATLPTPPTLRSPLALRGGAAAASSLASLGAAYATALASAPVLTKSATASAVFALSDRAAQRIEGGARDAKRTLTSALVGLLYFGPALHWWLAMLTHYVPGRSIADTLVKTLLGQCLFGPTITCVFFAASLVSVQGLAAGLARLPGKVRQDLLVTWASGLCFWPFVDLLLYRLAPVAWIPLGYNVASFLWTIYLSLQASRSVPKRED